MRRRQSQVGAVTGSEVVETRSTAPAIVGQVLILVAGAVLLLIGVLAIARAGVDDGLSSPVVSVLGFTHTAWLGIAEVVVGVLLLIGGASRSTRDLGLVLGVLLVVAGVVVLVEPSAMPRDLGIERSYGWLLVVLGAASALGGLLPGGRVRRYRSVGRRFDSGETAAVR